MKTRRLFRTGLAVGLLSVAIGVAAVSARKAAEAPGADAPQWGGPVPAPDVGAPAILGGDEIPDVIVSPGAGGVATRVLDGVSLGELGSGFPFGPGFGAGVRTAVGELNGDGVADIVVAMGPGGSLVKLFNGDTTAEIASGYPFGPGFAGGVSVATGDVNGDGREDIIVGQASGGGTVRVFSGTDIALLMSQAPFGGGYAGGVNVASGDVDGDGHAEVIVSQAAGGLVSVISGASHAVTVSGAPYGFLPGGVFVAAGDVNGDGRADVIAAPGSGSGPLLVYDVGSVSLLASFVPYSGFGGGVRVAAADLTSDGRAEILTVPGPGRAPELHVYDGATFALRDTVLVYPSSFTSGVFVSAPAAPVAPPCGGVTLSPPAGPLPAGAPGVPYSLTFTATGGTAHVFTVTGGALPGGLTLSSGGLLSGTPASAGNFSFTVTATNDSGCVASNAYTVSISSSAPQAQPDAFSNGVGNTQYAVGAAAPVTPAVIVGGTVLSNDIGSGLTAGPASIATTQGGHVAMSAAGTFLYTPPVGFVGSDTFTYAVTNGAGFSDTATVTINLGGVVWYVNAAAGAGDGRSHSPFNTMPAAATAAQVGQVIYVHGGPTPTPGATALKANQTLWGAGAPFALNGLTIPATTAPTLQGTITLANDVVVNALAVNGGAGPGLAATNIGGIVTIRDTAVTGSTGDGAVIHNQSGSLTLVIERTAGAPDGTCQFLANGARGLALQMEGTATATVTVDSCQFKNNGTIGLQASAAGDANLSLLVTGPPSSVPDSLESQFWREAEDQGDVGIDVSNSGNAHVTVTVENSDIHGYPVAGVRVGQAPGNASGTSMLRATIRGNLIASPADSTGPTVHARLSGTVGQQSRTRLLIDANAMGISSGIQQAGPNPGILVETPDAGTTPDVHVTVTDNHVDLPRTMAEPVGLYVQATQGTMCANIQGNWSHWHPLVVDPPEQGGGILGEQGGTATFNLERGSQPPGTSASTVIQANNPPPVGLDMIREALGSITVVENTTCFLPSEP